MYTYQELLTAYDKAGVTPGAVVYVTGNFGRPGKYERPGKEALLEGHFTALMELLGPKGTLVVPTHSFSLCNTNIPFDLNATKSERGPFTEFVRQRPGSVRQFHPFSSLTAFGYQADEICRETSRHAYGVHSPFQRMIDSDALFISLGENVGNSIALVHHVEFMMGVPYRYTKEFVHPCIVDGAIHDELFYLYVLWHECDIERDRNRKVMEHFEKYHRINKVDLGRSYLYPLSMKKFFQRTTELFRDDIYSWLTVPPSRRPYRK